MQIIKHTHTHTNLGVADDGLSRVIPEELNALLPLVNVVRVLPKQDGAHLLPRIRGIRRDGMGWDETWLDGMG